MIGYELVGPEDAPLVVVQGGISAGRHVAANERVPEAGWWEGFVGPQAPIDTERFRVLALDYLGGDGLTTQPHLCERRQHAGLGFPEVSSYDQAEITALLLEQLGAAEVHAFVGASYGAMVALAFAERFPERVRSILAISGAHEPHPMATAWRSLQRRVVRLGLEAGCADRALSIARGMGMATYRSPEEFAQRFAGGPESSAAGATWPVERYLEAAVGSTPALGVLYLQGHPNGQPFSPVARQAAELFARHLAPFADRLVERERTLPADPTAPFRQKMRLEGIIGRSAALARVLEQASLVAPLDAHVLLTGPSGSGKGALARAIARNGPRSAGPFVEVNCAAIPETLIESELFGARKGAHSTADRDLPGKVEAANGGTLFLDEIGELSLASQAKVLQLLQSRTYFALGATEPEKADVRIIAATNLDLAVEVRERRFRQDLLYRLEVLPIRLPALEERPEDLPLLADHFLEQASERYDLPPMQLAPSGRRAIAFAQWPGNVRQLAHVVQAAAIRAHGEGLREVSEHHVFPPTGGAVPTQTPSFQEATRQFQRRLLLDTLDTCDWNVTEAARRLDIARSHVYNLLEAFGLKRPKR